jgi:undecaprenyl diphosphate synthase
MSNIDAAAIGLNHLGVIVDGNRRWARQRGLATRHGHQAGYETLKKLAYAARQRGIKYLSGYIFSTDNWQRSKAEVGYLMDLFLTAFSQDMKRLVADGFRIVFLGRPNGLRAKIRQAIEKTERDSAGNSGTTLVICFNYGGQTEITDAAKQLASQVADGQLQLDDITETTMAEAVYHPEIPPLDMLVRTSGEQRLSGFMLWRAAYAELLFIDKNWPDVTDRDLDQIIKEFSRRQRRFGR